MPRILLIGCGAFAQKHLHAWRDLGCLPVAVCDRDPQRAQATAAAFGIPRWHVSAEEAIAAERPDAVDIVTGPETHRTLIELAIRRGVEAIVQKPIAGTWDDCRAIASLVAGSPVPVTVHENFRHQLPMQVVRRLLPRLGPVHTARIQFRTHFDIYALQPYLARGARFIIEDLGVHLFDLARCLVGEVEDLRCLTRRVNPAIAGEDTAQCLLQHAGGAISFVDCSYATWQERELFPQTLVSLEGRDGTLHLEPDYRIRLSIAHGTGTTTEVIDEPPVSRPWHSDPGRVVSDSVVHFCADWLSSRSERRQPQTHLLDHLRTTACVEAAYASAAANGAVIRPDAWC